MAKRIADRPATPAERARASRLRRRARLSERDRAWLARYVIAREAFAEQSQRGRKGRKHSALWEAEWFVSRFLDDVNVYGEVQGEWLIVRKKAHAFAEWNDVDADPIAFDDPPSFNLSRPNPSDRIMNLRVKVLNVTVSRKGKRGKTIMSSDSSGEWISLIALTDDWDNLNADVARAIEHLPERPSLRFLDDSQVEIAGVSVLVSDKRKEDEK
jgi:hypothetical protein